MGKTITKEKIDIVTVPDLEKECEVILHNCYCHGFEEVVVQLVKALGCSYGQADTYTHTAEVVGSVCIYRGKRDECERVAAIAGETGLNIDVV